MIVFDLLCQDAEHRFEGWFASSEQFASQQERGLLCCPQCGSVRIVKAPMAPAVPRKGNQKQATARAAGKADMAQLAHAPAMPPEAVSMMRKLAALQAEALKSSRWVGDDFVEQSRAMHYGERDAEPIHGQATIEEAVALHEEGVAVAPLLFPFAPPDKTN